MGKILFLTLSLLSADIYAYSYVTEIKNYNGLTKEECVRSIILKKLLDYGYQNLQVNKVEPQSTPLKYHMWGSDFYYAYTAQENEEKYSGHIFAEVNDDMYQNKGFICSFVESIWGRPLPLMNYDRNVFSLLNKDEDELIILN